MNQPIFLTLFLLINSNTLSTLAMLFLTLSIVFLLIPQIHTQCAENVYKDKDFLTCPTNHQLDSSMSAFPSYLKTSSFTKLSVDIVFNPVYSCNGLSAARDLFIMTVKDSSGQEVNVLSFLWLSGGSYQAGASKGLASVSLPFPSLNSFAVNKWIEFVATMDFDLQLLNAGINLPGSFYYNVVATAAPFYSSLKFDSTTKFYFCSSLPSLYTGANFHCSIKSLNLWYTFASGATGVRYYGGLSPVLLGYYQIDEGSGSSIKDSTGNLAKGFFGSPAPKWTSAGIKFTSTSQYIELPAFSTSSSSSNPLTTHSFTINFWLKFSSATGTANIFRYTTSSLGSDNFGLYIDNTGAITMAMGNKATTATSPFPVSSSVWTLITASYNIGSSSYSTYNPYYLYPDNQFTAFGGGTPSLSTGTLKVILGGPSSFLGTIAHFRISSPSSNSIQDFTTCSLSTSLCTFNLGMSGSSTCASYPCGSTSDCTQCSGGTFSTCLSCATDYEFDDDGSSCEPVPTSASPVIVPTQTTASAVSKVYNALTKGSSSGFSAAVAGKIFSNIKYLDIGYSLELQEALKYWKSSFVSVGMDLDLPQGLQDNIPELGVPPTFEKYDVSSDFLVNFYEGIIVLLFIVGLFVIARAIEYFTNAAKHKRFPNTTIRTARYMAQNLLLSQFDGMFGDIVMYSILNYRTQNPSKGLASFGLTLSASLLIITTIVLGSQFYLLVKYQQLKKNQEALQKMVQENQGSLIAFEDFKDTSLFRQAFFFILILRDFLFSLILTTLFEHPLVQTILILIVNLAVLAFLFVKQPFKERCGFFQQLFYEFVTLAVNISVIILAAKDQEKSIAYDFRKTTGKFIIITNLVFNFTVIVFLVFGIIMALKERYQEYQVKKVKRITISPVAMDSSPSQILNSSQFQEKSMMEFDSNKSQTENSINYGNKRRNIRQSFNGAHGNVSLTSVNHHLASRSDNRINLGQSFNRMEDQRFHGEVSHTSGNHLVCTQEDHYNDESQNPNFSPMEIQQRKYQDYLNRRQNHLQVPQREEYRPHNLRYHSNSISTINEVLSSQDYSQTNRTQNLNFKSKHFGQENKRNIEAEMQRNLTIQARNRALDVLVQPDYKRRITDELAPEFKIPEYIRGRNAHKKDN